MRSILKIHQAISAPVDDLITYRAMPTASVQELDPFLFLNHHGPQDYGPNNNGLPFGPHPHRGFETLTFIIHGDIMHKDSNHGESIIRAGGIQWMTAGKGLVHMEVSSAEFKKNGGREEVIQLWMNLPSHLKMIEPFYQGVQKDEMPCIVLPDGKVVLYLVSGAWEGSQGAINSITNLFIGRVDFQVGGEFSVSVEAERSILFYVVQGEVVVNGHRVEQHQLVEFGHSGQQIAVEAIAQSTIIFGHGKPFQEPIVAHGPFVMNTEAEIRQAIDDYQAGKFGGL